jgi:transcription elongation factor Elf1
LRQISSTIQIDLWVPIELVDQVVSWCHETFDSRDWDYHAPPLGENAVVARFYFVNPAPRCRLPCGQSKHGRWRKGSMRSRNHFARRQLSGEKDAMQFRCYYCGATNLRDLEEPGTVECLACGRSSKLKPEVFACPKCGSQSFMVIPGSDPVEVECLKCEMVSPFSVPTAQISKE